MNTVAMVTTVGCHLQLWAIGRSQTTTTMHAEASLYTPSKVVLVCDPQMREGKPRVP